MLRDVGVAWGLLSTARINRLVLEGARRSERVDIVAVASRSAARADAYAHEHGIERAYGSYDAMLTDPDVEAVYISLPNSLHVEWTLRALAAGKHVLCEKPLSRHPEDVERAFDAADGAGLVLSEAFMWRHNPQTAKLVDLVAAGAVGRLRMIRAAFSFDVLSTRGPEDVRLSGELEGGALMDVGCYCVNASRLLAGEPERAYAEAVVGASGVDVSMAGVLHFPGDVLAGFDCGLVVPYRAELEVVGEEGSVVLSDPWHVYSPGIELHRGQADVERIAIEPANSYQLQLENISDAIRGEAPLLLGRDDAIGQARVLAALYRSAAEGVPVALEPPAPLAAFGGGTA